MIALRPLDEDGVERLLALAVRDADPADVMPPGWQPHEAEWFREFYRGLLPDAYEITEGDATVGMIRLTGTGETGLWVARSARGRGVGRTAVARVVQDATGKGLGVVHAHTTTGNAAALAVLRRLGAEVVVDGDRARAEIRVPNEPPPSLSDPVELVLAYLDFYRDALLRKLDGMSEEDLRTSRVPSGWTPLAMVKHLAYVELRWMRLRFAGEDVENPRGTPGVRDAEWVLEEGDTVEGLRAFYLEQCARSREIAAGARLDDVVKRWEVAEVAPPTLGWILFHLLQEYARHLGHLDVVRELGDGVVGA